MGSKLLTDETVQGGSEETSEPPFSISEVFEECFPYYLSLGMTYDEYWNGDPSLVRSYRKAEDIRAHRRNWELWLQGRYVYEAIGRMIPSLNAFKPKEPIDYLEEPFPLTEKDVALRREKEEKRRQEAIKNKMMAFMEAQKNKKKEEQSDG